MTTRVREAGLTFGAVLPPQWLQMALGDAALASRTRRFNGLPETSEHRTYVEALGAALSAARHNDVVDREPVQAYPQTLPTLTVEQAAAMLGRSKRQTQRLAPRLGGRIVAGRWLLDEQAVRQHLEGSTWSTSSPAEAQRPPR